ncbi:hypothetical protein MTO96_035769 [Rhipicephalus appendiculatus]
MSFPDRRKWRTTLGECFHGDVDLNVAIIPTAHGTRGAQAGLSGDRIRSFPQSFPRLRQDGVPGSGRYYEFPPPAPREPYAGRAAPTYAARHGPYVAPSYQAPLRSSGRFLGRAAPLPQPLHYVHLQPPPAAPAASSHSRHYQPARPAPVTRAPPRPVASWQFAEEQFAIMVMRLQKKIRFDCYRRRRRSHHGRGSLSVSGFEGDAGTTAGHSLAASRYASGAATSGATTTRGHTTRSENSSSSSSSEADRVIHMMKTKNLPEPPPDNRQSAGAARHRRGPFGHPLLARHEIFMGPTAHPWLENATTTVAPIMANDTSVLPENLVDYDEGVVDTTTLV